MDGLVFVAVLGAAILHATWNAITKAVGRFGQVYPLARGLPPLLVTGFSLAVLGERPSS